MGGGGGGRRKKKRRGECGRGGGGEGGGSKQIRRSKDHSVVRVAGQRAPDNKGLLCKYLERGIS